MYLHTIGLFSDRNLHKRNVLFSTHINSFQFVATGITYGFSLSPPLELSYKLSDFDASMFPHAMVLTFDTPPIPP